MSQNLDVTVRARWIFPIDQAPIRDGYVTASNGRIKKISTQKTDRFVDLGDVALLPCFVNAHTHLEFSDLDKPLGHEGIAFCDWLKLVIKNRIEQSEDNSADLKKRAIQRGLEESLKLAVVGIGEIATNPWHHPSPTTELEFHLTAFLERIGLSQERAAGWPSEIAEFEQSLSDRVSTRFGLSPHAPYTVHPDLFESLIRRAHQDTHPVAIHLAETTEELELLGSNTGALRSFLESLGVYNSDAFRMPREPIWYLERVHQLEHALIVHGNYLNDGELRFIADHRHSMTLIYCPRTHAYFNHRSYPLSKALAAGIPVALGTDSRASSPDLNLFAEFLHAAKAHSDVAPSDLIKMITINSAKALGIDAHFGSLASGKHSSLAKVAVNPNIRDPYQALLAVDENRPSLVTIRKTVQDLTAD